MPSFSITCSILRSIRLFFNRICAIAGMRIGWVCARRIVRHNVKTPRRLLSTQAPLQSDTLSKATRNIGIIAHIDAVRFTGVVSCIISDICRAKQRRRSACSTTVVILEESEVCQVSILSTERFEGLELCIHFYKIILSLSRRFEKLFLVLPF